MVALVLRGDEKPVISQSVFFAEKLNADYTRIHILVPLKNTRMFEMVENEGLLNERYDHFNQKATWKAGQIESRNYTSNDLTILKAMEWDRLNFTDAEKRRKIFRLHFEKRFFRQG